MGAWGCGPFDNDTAMDFWGELVAGRRPSAAPDHGREGIVPDLTGLRGPADRALARVTSAPSELQDLWAESGGAAWTVEVARLRETLGTVAEVADQA